MKQQDSGPAKREVGIRELNSNLSRYVKRAAAGEELIVTMRGKQVARLVPIDEPDPLIELERRGILRRATRPRTPILAEDLIPITGGGTVSEFIER